MEHWPRIDADDTNLKRLRRSVRTPAQQVVSVEAAIRSFFLATTKPPNHFSESAFIGLIRGCHPARPRRYFPRYEYFAAIFFTVVEFLSVADRPRIFSSLPPENSESLNRVRSNQKSSRFCN